MGLDLRPDAWRYRDWVIQAMNDDMPYGQFVSFTTSSVFRGLIVSCVPCHTQIDALGFGFENYNAAGPW